MENYSKKRWSVTYTKHIKQKRKVYQDGFLDHHISTNKVKLFDDREKLLECKILKKGEEEEEVVCSGVTLTLNGYLVDIGDPEGEVDFNKIDDVRPKPKPNPIFIHGRKKFQSPSISSSSSSSDKKSILVNNLSPSKKLIREFKKSELQRYGASPSCPDTVKPGVAEWLVMYTSQMTQKSKKYHDGFLKLTSSGSLGRQLLLQKHPLLNAAFGHIQPVDCVGAFARKICNNSPSLNRRDLLDSRFLRNDEVIRSHESIKFDAHLVDIGEPEGESQLPGDSNIQGNTVIVVGKKGIKHEHQNNNNLEANRSMAKEWHALYTTQITQKAKKYHNGILRLASCGSYRMQVILLDEDKTILSSKFLNLSEDVRSGSTIMLPKYLVEIGEPHSPKETSNSVSSSKDAGSNFYISNIVTKEFQKVARSGEGEDSSSIYAGDRTTISKIATTNKSLRDIHQILSNLQKPIAEESVAVECTNNNMTESLSSANGLQVSDSKMHNPKDYQLPKESVPNEGPSEHKDNRGSSESAGIENYIDLEIPTIRGGQLSCDSEIGISDQPYLDNAKADIRRCDEAFASGFLNLAHDDKKKRTKQLKSAREIDEWPTFDLGF